MLEWLINNKLIQELIVHFVGLFLFITENARSKKQNTSRSSRKVYVKIARTKCKLSTTFRQFLQYQV
jgi:hypothetical protein